MLEKNRIEGNYVQNVFLRTKNSYTETSVTQTSQSLRNKLSDQSDVLTLYTVRLIASPFIPRLLAELGPNARFSWAVLEPSQGQVDK